MARRPKPNSAENRLVKALDALDEFEKFQEEILPILRDALTKSWSVDEIYGHPKVQALLAARAVTIGITDKDSGKALAAIKEAMDRKHGKATDRREVKHTLEKLSDSELDALLKTQLDDKE